MKTDLDDMGKSQFRQAGFDNLCEALDHAADSSSAVSFFDGKGRLDSALTYASLREKALAAASLLRREGLQRGDRLVLVADSTPEFLIAFYGCQYAGVVPCPIPPLTHAKDLESARRIVGAWMMNAQTRWIACPSTMAAMINMATKEIRAFSLSRLGSTKYQPFDGSPPDPDDIAYIQFSSGSTSFPKGILVSHRALMCNVDDIACSGLSINPQDVGFNWLPLHHDMGLVGFCIVPMCCQRPVDFISPHVFAGNPALWIELMSMRRTSIVFAPSFAWRMAALRLNSISGIDLSAIRVAGIGGDTIRPDDLASFIRKFQPAGFNPDSFLPCYGLAEATLAVSISRPGLLAGALKESQPVEHPGIDMVVSCGAPLPSIEVSIRNDHGVALNPGMSGHLWIKGNNIAKATLTGPITTDDDGFMDTGDMAVLEQGNLCINGRAKELIIIRGRNIWPQDVEETFLSVTDLPAIRVCCIGVEESGNEKIILFIQGEKDLDRIAIQEARERIVMTFGSSPSILIVPENSLPFTTSGKLARQRVRKRYLDGKITPIQYFSMESAHD